MIRIAFVHPHRSFLQNYEAYAAFFSGYGISTSLYYPAEIERISADCTWHFMGYDRRKKKEGVTIHEYSSASVPPYSGLKNRFKRWINIVPDFRIFNCPYSKEALDFRDRVPWGIREYGVSAIELAPAPLSDIEYDFIYLGTIGNERRLRSLFQSFATGAMSERTLLVLSQNYDALAASLRNFANIHFAGPVPHPEVANYIRKCRYGLNFIPDRIPFNQQPSAKLLDYCAASVPVISTDYSWVRGFQELSGGNFYFVSSDLKNFSWEKIKNFKFRQPDLSGWTWEEQIRNSGVLRFLEKKFPGLGLE